MKKLFIFSFIMAVTMGMVYSQSITVNQPSGGTWYKGTTHNITWTATGCSSTIYKINIFRGSIDPANFVEQLSKTGTPTKSWTIPMSYTNGTYYIRIKTDPAQTGCQGDSAAFQITDEPAPATNSITVNTPNSSTRWCPDGTPRNITWTKTGALGGTVKINIYKNTIAPANFVVQLTGPNSGSKSWSIPATYDEGTYILRIKDEPYTTQGDSSTFKLECEGGEDEDGPGLDPGMIEKLKDLMRRLERIPWWRNPKGPWPGPGPSPCLSCPVFDLGNLKDLLSKLGLKEQIGVVLYNGGQKIADFGKFGPKSRLGRKGMKLNKLRGMGLMQNRVGMKSFKMEHSKMFEKGGGFKLKFINSNGAVIAENGINLQEKLQK
ncbi:MAG: hypothetical protein ABFR75_09945 [Acidobacteriota bacterium]